MTRLPRRSVANRGYVLTLLLRNYSIVSCDFIDLSSLAGWCKSRPESGFSFVRFGFVYILVLLNCCVGFSVITWL